MIPRRFFCIFDILILVLAFMLADLVAPQFQKLLASKGILQAAWLSVFAPELEYAMGPIASNLWILIVASLPMLYFLEIDGADKWVSQSLTRTVLAGPAASLLGVSMVSLVSLALRNPPSRLSRLLLFLFGILSALGPSAYRLALREYYSRRKAAGYYVRNALIIGQQSALTWMARYFAENISLKEYRFSRNLDVPNHQAVAVSADLRWQNTAFA